ncbi:g3247 [Coccomyxa elongata]
MQARNTYDRSAILAGYIAPASTFSQTPAVPEEDDYDEDIEEDGFQELGDGTLQGSRGPQEPFFDGPAAWEEVDTEELERIAVNIMRSVVPSTENLEVGARLAMQAAAMEADNQDPLGLGRIDTRQLALIRADNRTLNRMKSSARTMTMSAQEGAAARRNLARQSVDVRGTGGGGGGGDGQSLEDLAGSRKKITTLENIQRRGIKLDMITGGARPGGQNLSSLRTRVMPTHEKFDSHLYLGTVHWETTLADLQAGRDNLQAELRERTGQLKALVKENFDHFISCKTTIDDIHKRLRDAEAGHAGGNSSYVSTNDVIDTVREVQNVAGHAFAELVERAAACDRIRGVLALLKRYENLFRLPTRIRQASERGLYDQVINEYKKARALMADSAATSKGGVWQSLFQEVEKGVTDMANTLLGVLRNPRTTPAEATDACKHLLLLQAESAPCMEHCDPIQLYLTTQERHVHALLEGAAEEHMVRLRGITQRVADQAASDARFKELQHVDEANILVDAKQAGAAPGELMTPEGLWSRYATRLTSIVVRHLRADYWHMPPEKEQALTRISDNARRHIENSRAKRSLIYDNLLREYSDKITSALTQLAGEGRSKEAFLAAVREVVVGMTKLCGFTAPPSAYMTLQQLLETMSGLAIGQMVAERATLVMRMSEIEDWDIVAASHKTGAPVSAMPGRLRAVVCAGMEQVQAVLMEAKRAEAVVTNHRFNTLGTAAAALRSAFFDSFTSFAVATDRLSSEIATSKQRASSDEDAAAGAATAAAAATDDDGIGADRKVLVLLSNCAFVRGNIMPTFASRFQGLLTADEGEQECNNLCQECSEDIKQAKLRLASCYTESKAAALNDVLEEFFFDDGTLWEAAPLPTGVRDVTYEILATMVGVEAEAYSNAPGLLRRVLAELLQHTLATFSTVLTEQLPETNLGGTLQLLVDLKFIAGAFSPLVRASHEAVIAAAREMIVTQALAIANDDHGEEPDPLLDQLDGWLAAAEASGRRGVEVARESPADRLVQACRTVAIAALKDSRMNLSCFRESRDAGGGGSVASASAASGRSVQSARSALSTRSSGA